MPLLQTPLAGKQSAAADGLFPGQWGFNLLKMGKN